MAPFNILQYICLKIAITILRALAYIPMRLVSRAPKSCERTLIQIPSRDKRRFIKAWVHYPPQYDEGKPQRLVINWHGSGFIQPSLGIDHEFCGRIAQDSNVVVIDADYRKAPEHPFPAAVEDVEDTLIWAESQPERFDLDRVAVTGFSAGGNLALVAVSELRTRSDRLNIRAVYAFYPLVDLERDPALKTVRNPINAFPPFVLRMFNTCYVPEAHLRKDPRVSPIYADPSLFPETIILFSCGGDNLGPESIEMGDKLRAGGANVEVVKLGAVPHGFDKRPKPNSPAYEHKEMTYTKVADSLKQAFEK